jgi:hypothetical protein
VEVERGRYRSSNLRFLVLTLRRAPYRQRSARKQPRALPNELFNELLHGVAEQPQPDHRRARGQHNQTGQRHHEGRAKALRDTPSRPSFASATCSLDTPIRSRLRDAIPSVLAGGVSTGVVIDLSPQSDLWRPSGVGVGLAATRIRAAEQPSDLQVNDSLLSADRQIGQPPLITTVHPVRQETTVRARRRPAFI